MAILSIIWAVVCKTAKSIAKGFKWLYDKTHGGIAWLLGGVGTVLAFLLFKGRTTKPGKPPLRPGLEQVKKQAEDLVKKAEQTKQAAEKALNHADEVVTEVENRRKKRQGPILPIIVIAILTAVMMLSGIALATESPLPLNVNATAIPDQALADAYLEQVRIAEEWRQRCLEADEDNAKLITEIRALQEQIQNQNAMIDSLTAMIKTLQGVIEELKTWAGQLYSLIASLTKRNVGVSTSAILKIDQQAVKMEGIMIGINW
mgnify:FL=1